jgi:hypothetical protein
MRLCAAGFTSSQRNPRYREMVVGRSILTDYGNRLSGGITPLTRKYTTSCP